MNLDKTLINMTKGIQSNSLRSYGRVLAVRSNTAYLTDGFKALAWSPGPSIGDDRCINKDFEEVEVSYPNIEAALSPKGDLRAVRCNLKDLIQALKSIKAKNSMYLEISKDLKASICFDKELPNSESSYFSIQNTIEYFKAIPKDCLEPTDILISEDGGLLVIQFYGGFTLTVVPMIGGQ